MGLIPHTQVRAALPLQTPAPARGLAGGFDSKAVYGDRGEGSWRVPGSLAGLIQDVSSQEPICVWVGGDWSRPLTCPLIL